MLIMSVRFARAIAASTLLLVAAPPAFAQQFSESYQFLEAVRKEDGTKMDDLVKKTNGTIVDTRDRETREYALHIVARKGKTVYLRWLLQKKANPNVQDADGNSPMMIAVNTGYFEGVQVLIRYKANINLANSAGETPLIRAVQLRNIEMVRELLANGADPDRTDVLAGMSARDYARADTRSPQIAKLLDEAKKIDRSAIAGPRL